MIFFPISFQTGLLQVSSFLRVAPHFSPCLETESQEGTPLACQRHARTGERPSQKNTRKFFLHGETRVFQKTEEKTGAKLVRKISRVFPIVLNKYAKFQREKRSWQPKLGSKLKCKLITHLIFFCSSLETTKSKKSMICRKLPLFSRDY